MTVRPARGVALVLTPAELEALLTMATSAEAGDLYELLGRNGNRMNSAHRALGKLRDAAADRGRH